MLDVFVRPVWFVLRTTFFCGAISTVACVHSHARPPAPAEGVLVPGAADLNTAHFRNASLSYRVMQTDSGGATEREVGESSDTTRLTTYKGAPAILLVVVSVTRGTPFIDSALVMRDGLSPVWEVQHYGKKVIRIDYSGAHVRRKDTSSDSVLRQADHTYGVTVFHFNELDALIRSVPLRGGYQAILPLYSEGDDALEMDTVRVIGRDSAGVWNVRFADKVIIGHYGIDGTTRELVRYDVERHAGGPHFHMALDR